MPATYAHHTFGEWCIESMPEKERNLCIKHRHIFDFGVHGPDLLFYYKPLSSNEVNKHGQDMHNWMGNEFFSLCKSKYLNANMSDEEKEILMAYMLGFLAHFTLDSSCHAYINEMVVETGVSHNLIESQYEAHLMRLRGYRPNKVNRAVPLVPSKTSAAVISCLFPLSEDKIYESMKGQKTVISLFYSPLEVKKKLIRKLISTFKIGGNFGDLFIDEFILPECKTTNDEIYRRNEKAKEIYPNLLENLKQFIDNGLELNEYFKYDFEGICHRD